MRKTRTNLALAASAGLAISATASAQIVNGNFETGDLSGWTIGATVPAPVIDPAMFHGGAYSAFLGSPLGVEPNGDGSLYQTLTVPAAGAVLTFWHKTFTQDSIIYDWQDAYIQDNVGTTLATIFHSCQTADWTQQTFDLAPYAGQTIRLTFLVHQDGFGDVTSLNIDDVALGPPLATGACCLGDGSCIVTNSGVCIGRNGLYRGNGSACAGAGCTPVIYTTAPLTWNFNGMVHDAAEQGEANRTNANGYRSISDRGLLLNGVANALNAAPIVDTDFMPFALVGKPARLDCVHLGDRNLVDNGTAAWGSGPNWGLQPTWLPNSNQTGPQVSDLSSLHATFTAQGSVGFLYQITNGGGRFDVVLRFTDNTSATVTLRGPDWFQNQSPPAPVAGSGVAIQRQLGVYAGTRFDFGGVDADLNVAEAVISVSSLLAAGMGDFTGKQLSSITFQNPICASNYPNPATGAGFAIIAATIGGTAVPSCYANCDHSTILPCLNVQDFGCFLNKFASGDTYANCDNSTIPPVLNVQDFGCFLNRFASGCSNC